MTVDEFVARIGNIGEQLDRITDRALAIAGPLVAEIKGRAPVKSGTLQSSIGIGRNVNADIIFLTMKDYGYFQNYGVKGTSGSGSKVDGARGGPPQPVEPAVKFALPPSGENFFKFGTKVTGLNAIGFFSMAEIQRRLVEGLQADIDTITTT